MAPFYTLALRLRKWLLLFLVLFGKTTCLKCACSSWIQKRVKVGGNCLRRRGNDAHQNTFGRSHLHAKQVMWIGCANVLLVVKNIYFSSCLLLLRNKRISLRVSNAMSVLNRA